MKKWLTVFLSLILSITCLSGCDGENAVETEGKYNVSVKLTGSGINVNDCNISISGNGYYDVGSSVTITAKRSNFCRIKEGFLGEESLGVIAENVTEFKHEIKNLQNNVQITLNLVTDVIASARFYFQGIYNNNEKISLDGTQFDEFVNKTTGEKTYTGTLESSFGFNPYYIKIGNNIKKIVWKSKKYDGCETPIDYVDLNPVGKFCLRGEIDNKGTIDNEIKADAIKNTFKKNNLYLKNSDYFAEAVINKVLSDGKEIISLNKYFETKPGSTTQIQELIRKVNDTQTVTYDQYVCYLNVEACKNDSSNILKVSYDDKEDINTIQGYDELKVLLNLIEVYNGTNNLEYTISIDLSNDNSPIVKTVKNGTANLFNFVSTQDDINAVKNKIPTLNINNPTEGKIYGNIIDIIDNGILKYDSIKKLNAIVDTNTNTNTNTNSFTLSTYYNKREDKTINFISSNNLFIDTENKTGNCEGCYQSVSYNFAVKNFSEIFEDVKFTDVLTENDQIVLVFIKGKEKAERRVKLTLDNNNNITKISYNDENFVYYADTKFTATNVSSLSFTYFSGVTVTYNSGNTDHPTISDTTNQDYIKTKLTEDGSVLKSNVMSNISISSDDKVMKIDGKYYVIHAIEGNIYSIIHNGRTYQITKQ